MFGFTSYFAVDRVGRNGGLAIIWKRTVVYEVISTASNFIDIHILEKGVTTWRLSCFYGYPERSRRHESWDLLCSLSLVSQLPWTVFGDFNNCLYVSDKMGKHPQALLDGF